MVWHLLSQLQHTSFLPHIPREAMVAQVLPASHTTATCHAVTTPRGPSMLTMVGLLASRRPLPQVCRERRGGLGDPGQGLRHLWHSVLLSAGTTQRRHDSTGFICSTGIERGSGGKRLGGVMILALSVQLGIWKGGGNGKSPRASCMGPIGVRRSPLDQNNRLVSHAFGSGMVDTGWRNLATCTGYTDRSTPTGNSAPVRFDHDDEETPRAASGRFKEHHHMARCDSKT